MNKKIKKRFHAVGMAAVLATTSLFSGSMMNLQTGKDYVKAATVKAIADLENPTVTNDNVAIWDCIYFGNYYQENASKKSPIKWRILSLDGNDAFLLADGAVEMGAFCSRDEDTEKLPTDKLNWENSELRSYLNGYTGTENALNKDFTEDNFLDAAFSSEEQDAILTTKITADKNKEQGGTDQGAITEDKLYCLSAEEATNASYGFVSDECRRFYNTNPYVHAGGRVKTKLEEAGVDTSTIYPPIGVGVDAFIGYSWWTRTMGQEYSQQYVYPVATELYGNVYYSGIYGGSSGCCIRPAMHVDLEKADGLWSYAGVVNSKGAVNGEGDRTDMATATLVPIEDSDEEEVTVAPTATTKVTETPKVIATPKVTTTPKVTEPAGETATSEPTEKTTDSPANTVTPEPPTNGNDGPPVPKDYEEEVDGITWSFQVYDGSNKAEYVRPADKNALPDKVVIPDTLKGYSVTRIGSNAFSESNVRSITVPQSVSAIEAEAFADCDNLKELNLPDKVFSTIYGGAFRNCKALKSISARSINDYAFEGCTNLETVCIPLMTESYTKVSISEGAFKGCTSLKEVKLGDTISELTIKANAFDGCTSLSNMDLKDATVTLYKEAFRGCTALKEITCKGELTTKSGVFSDCTSLEKLTVNGNATLAKELLSGCTNMKTVSLSGDTISLTVDQTWQAEEIKIVKEATVSGTITEADKVEKIVFEGKNPNLSKLTCTKSSKLKIYGYREANSGAGHDTVYQWAVAQGMENQFNNLGENSATNPPTATNNPGATQNPSATQNPGTTDKNNVTGNVKITFNGNGGLVDGGLSEAIYIYDTNTIYEKLPIAEYKGYQFLGWYTEASGGAEITITTKVPAGDTVLYAHWQKVTVSKGKIKSLKVSKGQAKVTIAKQSKAAGYEIVYAKKASFKGSKKVSTKYSVYQLPKAKKGTVYYVKVRAFKKDSTGRKVFGTYSNVAKAKMK